MAAPPLTSSSCDHSVALLVPFPQHRLEGIRHHLSERSNPGEDKSLDIFLSIKLLHALAKLMVQHVMQRGLMLKG